MLRLEPILERLIVEGRGGWLWDREIKATGIDNFRRLTGRIRKWFEIRGYVISHRVTEEGSGFRILLANEQGITWFSKRTKARMSRQRKDNKLANQIDPDELSKDEQKKHENLMEMAWRIDKALASARSEIRFILGGKKKPKKLE
jgi:hypothetical protein